MVNSLLRQWPASSLSAGEMKAVATVCGTAIAFYSHWQFAPKWLSPLIVTNLKVLALQLGDSPKFLVYKGLWPHHMILEVCWDSLGTLSFGLSQFHGHGSWLVCEVALNIIIQYHQSYLPRSILIANRPCSVANTKCKPAIICYSLYFFFINNNFPMLRFQ